ncbi:MAG: hypothetical protein KJ000_10825 [Pirellulaceae bacterium]|nr:hypothetical protein [Pirellulaceae bacterium]
MPENFNPYHQWLGLGQQTWNPDPYQLLGLTPGETDVARIASAADQAQNRLRSCSPGGQAAEWSRLQVEIEAARRSLLALASAKGNTAPAAAGAYRPAPRAKAPVSNPAPQAYPTATPAPGAVPMAAPVYPQASPAIPRAVPVQPAAPVAPLAYPVAGGTAVPVAGYAQQPPTPAGLPVATPMGASSAAAPVAARRTKTAVKARRTRKSSNLIVLASTAGGLMLVAAIVLLVVVMLQNREDNRYRPNRVAAVNPPPVPAPSRFTPTPDDAPTRRPRSRPQTPVVQPGPSEIATNPPLDSGEPNAADPVEPPQATEVPPMFGQDVVGNLPPSPVSDPPLTTPAVSEPSVTPPSSPLGPMSSSGLPMVTPITTPADPDMSPVPSPVPTKPEADGAAPTPEQIQELSRVLTAARTALEDGQFEEALNRLAGAEQLPMRPDHLERYQRLQLLAQYARNFRTELSKAMASLSGTDEIPVGTSTVVGVVESSADRITVRVAGANRTYGIDELPVGLATAIVDLRLAKTDPVSLVVKAAYLASRKDARDDQRAKAREWFLEAKQKGTDIGDLEKVLDDSYQLTP